MNGSVLASIRPVISKSKHVATNLARINEFPKYFDRSGIRHWMESCPVDLSKLNTREQIGFLFVFNAISFSYWGDPKWTVEYNRKTYNRGTWSMIAALKKEFDRNAYILSPEYLSGLTKPELARILGGKDGVEIPLLEERLAILNNIGEVAKERYKSFVSIVNCSGGDALELLKRITGDFESFRDVQVYEGKEVEFHKRAQLLVRDIAVLTPDAVGGIRRNVEHLTACADYINPMVLMDLRILEYSGELARKVFGRIPLQKDGTEEIEIRAHTIHTIHKLSMLLNVTQMELNDYFWGMGERIPKKRREHHLTEPRTTAY